MEDKNKEIQYIARRYKPGRFSVNKGWKRLGIGPSYIWRRYRVAAAVAATIFLSATAVLVYRQYDMSAGPDIPQQHEQTVAPVYVSKVIDFENTPLPTVLERIKEVYGVEVINVPEDAERYTLSLHYEGTALDLVETINDILGTQMAIKK